MEFQHESILVFLCCENNVHIHNEESQHTPTPTHYCSIFYVLDLNDMKSIEF